MNNKIFSLQLLNNINKNLINNKKIKKKQKILISISGGQDSICLFFIFIHLKKQWKWSIGIIYCNHLWQKNSFYSGSLVIKMAYLFTLPIYYTISSNKNFKEKSSRYWRYGFFYRLSFFYQYQMLNTGHTSNDKIETTLFQNIRGSSVKSLLCLHSLKYFYCNTKFTKNTKIKYTDFYSIYILNKNKRKNIEYINCQFSFLKPIIIFNQPVFVSCQSKKKLQHKASCTTKNFYKNYLNLKNISYCITNQQIKKTKYMILGKKNQWNNLKKLSRWFCFVARPILLLNRFDLKKLLLFWKLPIYPDISNQKRIYYRNKIRKDLLPTLKFFFNPQIEKSFFQFELIRLEEQFILNLLLKRIIIEIFLNKNQQFQLNIFFLKNLPLSIQRKLINQVLQNITTTQIQFTNIQDTINFFEKKKNYIYSLFKNPFFLNTCKLFIDNFNPKKSYKQQFWFLNQFKNCYLFPIKNRLNKKEKHKKKIKIWNPYIKKIHYRVRKKYKIWVFQYQHLKYVFTCNSNTSLYFISKNNKFKSRKVIKIIKYTRKKYLNRNFNQIKKLKYNGYACQKHANLGKYAQHIFLEKKYYKFYNRVNLNKYYLCGPKIILVKKNSFLFKTLLLN